MPTYDIDLLEFNNSVKKITLIDYKQELHRGFPHTIHSRDIIEFGLPEMLLQPPSGLLKICSLFLSQRLRNICEGQTVVVSLLLRADYTNHTSVYLIKVSGD